MVELETCLLSALSSMQTNKILKENFYKPTIRTTLTYGVECCPMRKLTHVKNKCSIYENVVMYVW